MIRKSSRAGMRELYVAHVNVVPQVARQKRDRYDKRREHRSLVGFDAAALDEEQPEQQQHRGDRVERRVHVHDRVGSREDRQLVFSFGASPVGLLSGDFSSVDFFSGRLVISRFLAGCLVAGRSCRRAPFLPDIRATLCAGGCIRFRWCRPAFCECCPLCRSR